MSCICWSSETRAAGDAPEQMPTEIGLFAAVSDGNSAVEVNTRYGVLKYYLLW